MSARVRLCPIESDLTLVGFSRLTMEIYQDCSASGKQATGLLYIGLSVNLMAAEEIWKRLSHAALCEIEMGIIHEEMVDMLKSLYRCGCLWLEANADGGEKRTRPCYNTALQYNNRVEGISCVKHGFSKTRLQVRPLATARDIQKLKFGEFWTLRDMS